MEILINGKVMKSEICIDITIRKKKYTTFRPQSRNRPPYYGEVEHSSQTLYFQC